MGLTVLIQPTRAEEEYSLGFSDKNNYTLIYEYSVVDEGKLEYLYEQTGYEVYEDLAKISEKSEVKVVIANVEEDSDNWKIICAVYSGDNLEKREDDLTLKVYKDPSDLKEDVYEESESEASFLHFVPINTEKYLEEFTDSLINDDRYSEIACDFMCDNRELTFDYAANGYSDTIVQEFNEDGTLKSLTIYCDDKEAFKYELKESYEDYGTLIFIVIIIVVSIGAIGLLSFYIYYRKQNRIAKEPESKVDKLIKKIK